MTQRRRASGILLHVSSLPGGGGIGDVGPGARRLLEFLAAARQRLWQVLPLSPTGWGNSPYSGQSAFAGNPLLLSLELLVRDGLLRESELPAAAKDPGRVDYPGVAAAKLPLLALAHERLLAGGSPRMARVLQRLARQPRVAAWLDDYALFAAIKESRGGRAWWEWDRDLAIRRPRAVASAARDLAAAVERHRFLQLLFLAQWGELRDAARGAGVRLIGDMPIYVAPDSADVWARRDLFAYRNALTPSVVAGVPPDYFSATGQLWGNPLYRWERMRAERFRWWIERLRMAFSLFDIVRIDHFRGFAAGWAVPFGARTAERGRWRRAPGAELFAAAEKALGKLAIVAEDLGVITPDVDALRARFGYPGMRVLQFAFGSGPENAFLPHNYERRTVVYTGTHDNDTLAGWLASLDEALRAEVLAYAGSDGAELHWDLVRLAHASVADTAIVPLQDLLGLDSSARMNTPAVADGNWEWRVTAAQLGDATAERLAELTERYGRG